MLTNEGIKVLSESVHLMPRIEGVEPSAVNEVIN